MDEKRPLILHLITQAEYGGAQKYVEEIVTGLSDEFRFVVGAGELSKSHELLIRLEKRGYYTLHLTKLHRSINPYHDIGALLQMERIISRLKPEILHLHTSKISVLGTVAAILSKYFLRMRGETYNPKIIYTSHGWVFNEKISRIQKWFYIAAEKISGTWKDVIIVLSRTDEIIGKKLHIGKPSQYTIVPNGITLDTTEFHERQDARALLKNQCRKKVPYLTLESHGKELWIGVIANLYENKGLDVLVRAMSHIEKIYQEQKLDAKIRAVILGEGMMEEKLRAEIALHGVEETVLLAGGTKDAWKFLPAFDIFCLPSYKEGFPYAVLEAMDAGIPCVVSSVGALPEFIVNHENGVLVEPGNDEQLSDALMELLHHEDARKKMGLEGQKTVRKNFTRKNFLQKISEIYHAHKRKRS